MYLDHTNYVFKFMKTYVYEELMVYRIQIL